MGWRWWWSTPATTRIRPGPKTDVGAAAWLGELLWVWLLGAALVAPPAIRQLRELVRDPKRLIQAQGAEVQRIHKTWRTPASSRVSVATDVLGVSGRAMLAAWSPASATPAAGRAGPGQAAQQAPPAGQALRGRFGDLTGPSVAPASRPGATAGWPRS